MSVASVQGGSEISVEVTYDNPSLFVAAKFYDDSGVSPSLVGSAVLMANFSGNSYRCKFTPVVGKTYVVNKAVYTDGTFATVNNDYSQGSDSFQAVQFSPTITVPATGDAGLALAEVSGDVETLAIDGDHAIASAINTEEVV